MQKPMKAVVTPSRGRVVGHFTSIKNNGRASWESQIERDNFKRLEVSHDVIRYCAQYPRLEFYHLGRKRRYTADCWVEYVNETVVYEVKPDKDVESFRNDPKFQIISLLFQEQGLPFRIMPESKIRQQPYLDNAKLILSYKPGLGIPANDKELYQNFDKGTCLSIEEAAETLGYEDDPFRILAYVPSRSVHLDLNAPINHQTIITIA